MFLELLHILSGVLFPNVAEMGIAAARLRVRKSGRPALDKDTLESGYEISRIWNFSNQHSKAITYRKIYSLSRNKICGDG